MITAYNGIAIKMAKPKKNKLNTILKRMPAKKKSTLIAMIDKIIAMMAAKTFLNIISSPFVTELTII